MINKVPESCVELKMDFNSHEKEKITVAIPTYNRAMYLKESIKAIVNQTYKNLDIFISDNCSTDHTEEVVNSFQDKRIRYLKQNSNTGLVNNYCFCINNCTTKYIMITSDDDILELDCIEKLVAGFDKAEDVLLVTSNHSYINSEGDSIRKPTNHHGGIHPPGNSLIQKILERKFEAINGSLYKTELLRSVHGLTEVADGIDLLFELYAALRGKIYIYEEVLYKYRLHEGSISQNVNINANIRDWLLIYDYLVNNESLSINKKLLDKSIIKYHMYAFGRKAAMNKNNDAYTIALKKLIEKCYLKEVMVLMLIHTPLGPVLTKLYRSIKSKFYN